MGGGGGIMGGGDIGGGERTGNGGDSGEDEGPEPRSPTHPIRNRASPGERVKDATVLLEQDHQRVKRLFDRFERAGESSQRLEAFQNIRNELQVHTVIEEEIFYPELERQRRPDLEQQVREAHQEHDEARQIMARAEGLDGDSVELQQLVRSLREAVEHHVQEEEGEMFAGAREAFSASQLNEIGARLDARRRELVEQGMRELVEV